MVFAVSDDGMLQDVVKLVFSFVDRLQHQVGISERKLKNICWLSYLRSLCST